MPAFMKGLFFVGVSLAFALFLAVISRGKHNGDTAPIPSVPNLKNANGATAARPSGVNKDDETPVGRPFPTAVVHVGPTKTGSTSIQIALMHPEYLRALAADNYAVPVTQMHYTVTACAKDRNGTRCGGEKGTWNIAVRKYRNAWEKGQNVIFSCEELFDSKTPSDYDALDELFANYKLHVVVVYRRFYDWLHSLYGQSRNSIFGMEESWSVRAHKGDDPWSQSLGFNFDNTNIVSWLRGDNLDVLYNSSYTTAAYRNYARRYGDENVALLNFHDGDVVEDLFCSDGGLRSPSACELRRRGEVPQEMTNAGVSTVYDELAIAAYDMGLLAPSSNNSTGARGRDLKGRSKTKTDFISSFGMFSSAGTDENSVVTRPEAREAIRYHHEVVLNRTSEDFTRICPPTETMNRIHQLSLDAERMLMPEFFNSKRGEHALQSDFESRSHAMFCSVDVDSVLDESIWKEFFLGLVESRSNGNGINEEGDQ